MDGRVKVRLMNDPNNPGKFKWVRKCIAYKCANMVNPETEERGILFHRLGVVYIYIHILELS